ncbi:MAG: hypothetical protein ACYS7M_07640, partial [Planctomycetota bacterium]
MVGFGSISARISLLLVGAVALTGGCNDAASNGAATVRRTRIRHYLARFAAHEADGQRRVDESVELAARLERSHADKLQATRDLISRRWRQDVEHWQDGQPEYHRRI